LRGKRILCALKSKKNGCHCNRAVTVKVVDNEGSSVRKV
jgi:hypothetical protein